MDEDIKSIAPVLIALRELNGKTNAAGVSLEDIDRQFRIALAAALKAQATSNKTTDDCTSNDTEIVAPCVSLRPEKFDRKLLARIQEICRLTERQARSLTSTGLVFCDKDKIFVLRDSADVILSRQKAIGYLCACGFLLLLAIASILTEPMPGFLLVLRGAGLGIAVGATANLVLERSFRIYPVADRLDTIRSWLSSRPAPSRCG